MNFETNRNQKIILRKEAIWNVHVRVFESALVFHRVLSAPGKSWNLKVVLN
jgi:hypothetical protein